MALLAPPVLVYLLVSVVVVASANFDAQNNFFFPPYPNFGTPPSVSYTPPISHGGPAATIPTPPIAGHGNPPSGAGKGHQSHSTTPSTGGGGAYHNTPPAQTIPTTPPSPFSPLDPNSSPFSCTYWKNHPALVLGLVGWWGTMHGVFGAASLPGYGPQMNFLQALSNTHTDGFGQLYREGTAALLNSMAHTKFPYSTMQVRDGFMRALASNKVAAAQARLFKAANEGKA